MAQAAKSRNLTDRALRYRANADPPEGEARCCLCGTVDMVEVGHVNGKEQDNEPENLFWTCRSCNVKSANTMRAAGLGRLTNQYNPSSGGARTVAQWVTAVMSMKGESSVMPVDEAVEMVRATSPAKRSEFAKEIWDLRKSHRRNGPDVIDQAVGTGMDLSDQMYGLLYGVPYSFFQKGVQTSLQLKDAVKKKLGLNPQAVRRLKNGSVVALKRNSAEDAEQMFQKFHGNEPEKVLEIEYEIHEHENLAALGALVSVVIDTPTGYRATFGFGDAVSKEQIDLEEALSLDTVWLCTSEDGKQLYFEGGDQSIDLASIDMDTDKWLKDSMVLGTLIEVTYRTRKKFDSFKLTDYYHELGEETGVMPALTYDPNSVHLYVTGGQYKIKKPLIGVSPGIEN